jgi:hypothetical protein
VKPERRGIGNEYPKGKAKRDPMRRIVDVKDAELYKVNDLFLNLLTMFSCYYHLAVFRVTFAVVF